MQSSLFQAPTFLERSNIYEVNIRQYTPEGTFNAFSAHLPRLKEMGVEILWLMPVHPIGVKNRKGILGSYYSIRDYNDVNPEFGSKEDFKALVEKSHALGFRLIIDWVANHTSWDHEWTYTNPDFFLQDESENFKVPFDWEDVIQIDHANRRQQEKMISEMKYWITEFDIDGFRADMAHLVPVEFWIKARTQLSPFKKDLIWLGETEEKEWCTAFDITYAWNRMHKSEEYCKKKIGFGELISALKTYLTDFPPHAMHLFFTTNHDENSWNGTEYEKYGNLAQAFAVFDFTFSSIPLIYSGQELPNKKRLRFFEKDVIDWTSNISLQAFYKTLLSFRAGNPAVSALQKKNIKLLEEGFSKNVLAYYSKKELHVCLVVLNLGENAAEITYNLREIAGTFRNIFSEEITVIAGSFTCSLASGEYLVLEKQ